VIHIGLAFMSLCNWGPRWWKGKIFEKILTDFFLKLMKDIDLHIQKKKKN
jgi:hypothetical protein